MESNNNNDWIAALPDDTAQHVRKLIGLPNFPRQLAKFSGALKKLKPDDKETPKVLAERARRLAPIDALVRKETDWAFQQMVPRWHYGIINNEERNEIYREALKRQVKPGMIVFEIGTGSGLLAMLAAQAGAGHVYTCEREPLLVEAARENIARNGFSDRVTVIDKDSKEVEIGADLPERADMLVCEIVDNGLLSEFALDLTAVWMSPRSIGWGPLAWALRAMSIRRWQRMSRSCISIWRSQPPIARQRLKCRSPCEKPVQWTDWCIGSGCASARHGICQPASHDQLLAAHDTPLPRIAERGGRRAVSRHRQTRPETRRD